MPIEIVCVKCFRNENLKKCSRCKSVSYCSITCQKEDWSLHKKMCKINDGFITESNTNNILGQLPSEIENNISLYIKDENKEVEALCYNIANKELRILKKWDSEKKWNESISEQVRTIISQLKDKNYRIITMFGDTPSSSGCFILHVKN